jgi:phospholipid/cholesterol/gamma-HCH transport system permease protein
MTANADAILVSRHTDTDGGSRVSLHGRWDIRAIHDRPRELLESLRTVGSGATRWDLTQIRDIDAAGATLMWHAWDRARPAQLAIRPEDAWVFDNLATLGGGAPALPPARHWPLLARLGRAGIATWKACTDVVGLLGAGVIDSVAMWRHLQDVPRREITATIFRSGTQALLISGLVGFLIGIVLCYLSGQQLRDLGAGSYVVNLVGFAVLRELGPLLAAILNAGRSGSAITAQIGVMRVTEELSAMSVLGISHVRRLVVPKLIGQVIALPLVVVWTDLMAILGAMLGAKALLRIAPTDFLHGIVRVIPLTNLLFGVGKGALFGATVALISCYFGFRIRPDSESLAAGTTSAVVTSLTAVLMLDAALAIAFANVGM